ncbi:MAG: HTH domain-containing protein, partial [Patescibacteria group bacterium]|nr:HTH domain-containing protein [Patescibacteria group bacterium]
MRTNTADKIIKYIKNKKQTSADALANYLGISRQALYKQLTKLLNEDRIYKIGRPPKVFYLIKKSAKQSRDIKIDKNSKKVINENFFIITPSGQRKEGIGGFVYWCEKHNQPLEKTAKEYIITLRKYKKFKKNGLIDGMYKIKQTLQKVFLDKLFYLDFYSIERFGKTKLGQFLLYAKQSQDKKIINELVGFIKPSIDILIKKYKIDGVGFIPPTVKREVQFMKEFEKKLNLSTKKISITKIKTEIIVPQKTLSGLSDRIEN